MTAFDRTEVAQQSHQINITVSPVVHQKLAAMAKEAGAPVSTYARMLFDAAYAARHKPTGDAALDASVARILLLHRHGVPPAVIAEVVELPPGLVSLTIDAWRKELTGGAA